MITPIEIAGIAVCILFFVIVLACVKAAHETNERVTAEQEQWIESVRQANEAAEAEEDPSLFTPVVIYSKA